MAIITNKEFRLDKELKSKIGKRFQRTGLLTLKKLMEYLPTMIMTNLSVLLLVSVDGLVVGNLVGPNALSSVNIFYPATVLIGAASALISSGAATTLSNRIGQNDYIGVDKAKDATIKLTLMMAVLMSIIQIPIISYMIASYPVSQELKLMTWQYAIGIMIVTPFGLISSVGALQLQIVGEMRSLMILTVLEGITNLIMNLFFVGVIKTGVAGAGYGTMVASILRCIVTVWYLRHRTTLFKRAKGKAGLSDMKEVLHCGLPEAANLLMLAFQNYFMMEIIISGFGDDAGVIRGVTTFCFSFVNVVISGIQSAMRPLTGLMSGIDDKDALRLLVIQSMILCFISVGVLALLVIAFPDLFYHMHGVRQIPAGGIESLRIYSIFFALKGYNTLFRLYFSNRNDSRYATGLTVVGNATLPAFAFLLSKFFDPIWIWAAYTMTELLILVLNLWRYNQWLDKDYCDPDRNPDEETLSISLDKDQAALASQRVHDYARKHGASEKTAYYLGLCTEEMVSYSKASQDNEDLNIQILIRFNKDKEARFVMLDDGKCIKFNKDEKTKKLTTDNYEVLRRLAKKVDYQYVLNMNFTNILLDAA